jgi:hypothetical protein
VSNLPAFNQPFSLLKSKDDFVLLNTVNNQLTVISADGNDNIKLLMDTAYSFAAVSTSDSSYSYFYSSGNQLRAYNNQGEFIGSSTTKEGAMLKIELLKVADKNYLQIADEANGITLVYDLSLKLVNEFKINPFNKFCISDIFNRQEWTEIITDEKGNISCYRLR